MLTDYPDHVTAGIRPAVNQAGSSLKYEFSELGMLC